MLKVAGGGMAGQEGSWEDKKNPWTILVRELARGCKSYLGTKQTREGGAFLFTEIQALWICRGRSVEQRDFRCDQSQGLCLEVLVLDKPQMLALLEEFRSALPMPFSPAVSPFPPCQAPIAASPPARSISSTLLSPGSK